MQKKLYILLFIVVGFIKLNAQTVYVTEKGKKYHTKNCTLEQGAKKSISLNDAKKMGYEACKICKTNEIKAIEEKEKKEKIKNKKRDSL